METAAAQKPHVCLLGSVYFTVGLKPFEQVVTEHGPTVLRVCRALVGPHDADDAWSETFLSALKTYPQLPEGSNVQARLVTIAQRKAIDLQRSRARRPFPVHEIRDRSGPPPPERDDDLWHLLGSLSSNQRSAVVYHHIAGLPYAEVGQILGTSAAAARRAAADGIKKLRLVLVDPPTERKHP